MSIGLDIEITRHGDCETHNHDQSSMDIIKRNLAVRNLAGNEVGKGYRASEVARNMKGVVRPQNRAILNAAGGQYLSLLDCHNAGAVHKAQFKDERLKGHIDMWEEQRQDAKYWLLSQGWKVEDIHAIRQRDGKLKLRDQSFNYRVLLFLYTKFPNSIF